ncbi:MAG: hypothetical protein VX824_01035, partial [Pseudomonadota bacterium]|nr:hypothetical protein [Pseudomonadota bacterium]
RAELCLSCHFGNDKKIVTHRIMGAGHPRLDFELDTFTATQPAHYEIDKDYYKRKVVSNGIQTWAIGQALALEKRFDALLKMGETGGIFPELVLFDCQACHHSLMTQKWQPRPGTGLGPGVVRFDDSNLLMLQIIVESIDEERGEALQRKTIQLHKASTANSKEFYAVADSLRDEAKELVSVFAKYKFGKKDVENLLFNLVQRTKETEFFDYVGAEQAIMGITSVLAAADKMGMKKSTKQIQASLDNAYKALENYDSWDYAKFKTAVGKINLN